MGCKTGTPNHVLLWCALFGVLPLSGCIARIVHGRTLAAGLSLRKAGAQHQFCYGLSVTNFVQVVIALLGVVLSLLVRDWRTAGRLKDESFTVCQFSLPTY